MGRKKRYLDICVQNYRETIIANAKNKKNTSLTKCTTTNLNSSNFEHFFFSTAESRTNENINICKMRVNDGEECYQCFSYCIFIDLVAFKSINDRFSHGLGDCILKAFADHLHQQTQSFGKNIIYEERYSGTKYESPIKLVPYRHGGDEFTCLAFVFENDDRENLANEHKCPKALWLAHKDELIEFLNKWSYDTIECWVNKMWAINGCFSKGASGNKQISVTDFYDKKAMDKMDSDAFILIKGLHLRAGVVSTIMDPKVFTENSYKGDRQRGVINEEAMIYCETVTRDAKIESDSEHWKCMREYIFIVLSEIHRNDVDEVKAAFERHIDEDKLLQTFKEKIEKKILAWGQGDEYYIGYPLFYGAISEYIGLKRGRNPILNYVQDLPWHNVEKQAKQEIRRIVDRLKEAKNIPDTFNYTFFNYESYIKTPQYKNHGAV